MDTTNTRTTGIGRREFLRGSAAAAAGAWLFSGGAASAAQAPASAGPPSAALVEDLIAANRILAREGLVDAFGHVSVRHDRDPSRFLLSRSLAPELVGPGDLIEYDLDSNPVDTKGFGQYSERFIHGEIYKARPDVRAVVHNHSPSAVAFGVSSVPLRAVYHMAAFLGEGLPVFDIRAAAGMTEMLVNDSQRGQALAAALGDGPAVLMRGHGVAVAGPSLPFAVGRSVYIELNARIQTQAMSLGGEVRYLDPQEVQNVLASGENAGYTRPWEMWKRQVMGP